VEVEQEGGRHQPFLQEQPSLRHSTGVHRIVATRFQRACEQATNLDFVLEDEHDRRQLTRHRKACLDFLNRVPEREE
jgi:hypothetical protein